MGEFLSRELTVGQCDPFSHAFFSRNKDSSVYVVVNFVSQVIFIFLLFSDMVMYANVVETKEK